MTSALASVIARPMLSHALLALAAVAVLSPLLAWARVRSPAWHAASYTSLFFYTREAAQAERALKPVLGDPAAFFTTLWPGAWTAGGAHLGEWLAPLAVAFLTAAALQRVAQPRREIKLPPRRP